MDTSSGDYFSWLIIISYNAEMYIRKSSIYELVSIDSCITNKQFDEDENKFSNTVSNGSDAEMSPTKKQNNTNINKLQQLNDEPQSYKQTSTGSIIESITRTVSQIANNKIINYTTDTFNTPHYYATTEYNIFNNNNDDEHNNNIIGIPFKDDAPHIFGYLRQEIYEISDYEYLESVRPPSLEEQTKLIQETFSGCRSGAFFCSVLFGI